MFKAHELITELHNSMDLAESITSDSLKTSEYGALARDHGATKADNASRLRRAVGFTHFLSNLHTFVHGKHRRRQKRG
jgi:hypothetical protein